MHFFAGAAGWCRATDVGAHWEQIASANWLATASHAARCIAEGVLIDIGSTTTDLIAFRAGHVLAGERRAAPSSPDPRGGRAGRSPALGASDNSRSDAARLATGELVYHGVVRTPLCALGPRIAWQGRELNVMNEFFATTADVYRLTHELDPEHDQHPSADNAPKDVAHTCARLARMIGLDGRDAGSDEWLAFARDWRARQCDELRSQVARVAAAHALGPHALAVGAGCGAFLVPELVPAGWRVLDYGRDVADVAAPATAAWARVGAPAVAVASLYEREQR